MNSVRMMSAALFMLGAVVSGAPAFAAEDVTLDGSFSQGGMVIGTAPPGATVEFDGREVRISPDGRFVIGFHRDDPPDQVLTVTRADGTVTRHPIRIAERDYDIQRIDGLPENKVSPPEEVVARIREEAARVREARARDSDFAMFGDGFLWPADGRITGVYGSQRVLNGQPRQPHYGVDIAAPVGTPVIAPAAGMVSFADPDLYFSGGTLMIDHGHGLASTFLHMETISVAPGDWVEKGARIGTIGATGRATGPHLDWRVNWFEKRLDPLLLAQPPAQ